MSIMRKKTSMVPMRDGIKLATDVYCPTGEGPWPVLLARLMYDKNNIWFLKSQSRYRTSVYPSSLMLPLIERDEKLPIDSL